MTAPAGATRRQRLLLAAAVRSAGARRRWARAETWGWSLVVLWMTSPLQCLLSGVDPAAPARAAGSLLYRELHLALLPLATAALLARAGAAWRLARSAWPALVLVLYAALSTAWSQDRAGSLKALGRAAPMVAAAAALVVTLRPARAAEALLLALALASLGSVAAALLLPRFAVTQPDDVLGAAAPGLWRGLYLHKNVLGHVAGLAAAGLGCRSGRLVRPPLLRWSGFGAALACLLLSRSVGGAVLAAALPLLQGLTRGRWRPALLGFGAVGLGLLAATPALSAALAGLGRDATLSGRTAIWRRALDLVAARPLLGSGLDYSATPAMRLSLMERFGVDHLHNAALDVLLNLGAAGLLLWLAAVAAALGGRRGAGEPARGALTLLATGWLLSGLTEDMAVRSDGPIAALGACALAGLYGLQADRRSFRRPAWRFAAAARAPRLPRPRPG